MGQSLVDFGIGQGLHSRVIARVLVILSNRTNPDRDVSCQLKVRERSEEKAYIMEMFVIICNAKN